MVNALTSCVLVPMKLFKRTENAWLQSNFCLSYQLVVRSEDRAIALLPQVSLLHPSSQRRDVLSVLPVLTPRDCDSDPHTWLIPARTWDRVLSPYLPGN